MVFDAAYMHDNLKIRLSQRPAWLTATPGSGTTPPGDADTVIVGFHAAQYEDGDHLGEVRIGSNDPFGGSATVPCTMHVGVEPAGVDFSPNALSAALGGNTEVLVSDANFVDPLTAYVNRAVGGSRQAFTAPTADFRFGVLAMLPVVGEGKGVHVEVIGEDGDRTWYAGDDTIKVIKPEIIGPIPLHAYASGLPTASIEAGAGIVFRWQDPAGVHVTHYALYYSPNGGDTWQLVAGNLTDHHYTWFVPQLETQDGMIELVAFDGDTVVGSWISDPFVIGHGVTGVDGTLPGRYAISFAGSNPARGSAALELALPARGNVEVRVHDVRGALVRTLARGEFAAGRHPLVWDGADANGNRMHSGVYFVQAIAGGRTLNLRIVMLH